MQKLTASVYYQKKSTIILSRYNYTDRLDQAITLCTSHSYCQAWGPCISPPNSSNKPVPVLQSTSGLVMQWSCWVVMSCRLLCIILTTTETEILITHFGHTPCVHKSYTVLLVYIIYCVLIKTLSFITKLLHGTVYVHGFSQHLLMVATFWVPRGSGTWLGWQPSDLWLHRQLCLFHSCSFLIRKHPFNFSILVTGYIT